jgi:hypothetical protein
VDCYLSSKDTGAGTRWTEKIFKELGSNNVGIICLSSENLENRWIHFESGAIATKTGNSRLCPLLIDLKKTDVPPPLSFFQMKTLEKEEMFSVIEMINEDGGDRRLTPEKLKAAFETWWMKLQPAIERIKAKKPLMVGTERSERDLLEEILDTVRSLDKTGDILEIGTLRFRPNLSPEVR